MAEKTICVGKAELLEWLADWGEVGEGDEVIKVRIGYGPDIEFIVGNPNEEGE